MSRPDAAETYPHVVTVPTRWNDNDQFGHVNNTVHYAVMDTVINDWLAAAGFDNSGALINLIPETGCRYLAEIAYPDPFVVGLRVARLGTTSVTWELLLCRASDGAQVARGRFVHVFVERDTRRPAPIPDAVRERMAGLAGEGAG